MIEDLLQQDAQAWQCDVDRGARPAAASRRVDWRPLAAVAAVLVVVAGVLVVRTRHDAADPAAAPSALTSSRWFDPASGGEVVFHDRSIRVFDTCVNQTFRLHVDRDRFTIGAPVPGGYACAGGPPDAARLTFDRVVTGTVRWSRIGDTLHLTKGTESVVLHAGPLIMLTGTTWRLDELPTLDDQATIPNDITLVIGADGSVRANDICGTVTGRATITATTVVFRTRTDCIDSGFSPQTREIDTVLGGTASYRIENARLILQRGNDVLVYRAS